jgi:hypothetical protein
MDFAEALKAMRMGSKVARFAWHGKIFFWAIEKEGLMQTGFAGHKRRQIKKMLVEDVLAKDWHIVT